MPLHDVSTNARKRKSAGSSSNAIASQAPKKPRHSLDAPPAKLIKTIDTFFSPRISVRAPEEDTGGTSSLLNLSHEQNRVLRMAVDEGKSIFFTGSAGTGKSLLLRTIIASLRKKYPKHPEFVSVTASTGMAASNIGGMTLHSWGAIAPNIHNVDNLVSYINKCKPALQRWKRTKVLVIDEVSMVDAQLFQTISNLAERLRRKTTKPFGGIQLVVTGDFFQLPPVFKPLPNSSGTNTSVGSNAASACFAFEAEAWKNTIEHTINLTQVFRQKDTTFVNLLNELRRGEISQAATSTFRSLSRPLQLPTPPSSEPPPSQLTAEPEPTELFPLRQEVSRANSTRLAGLKTPAHMFAARDSGKAEGERRAKLLETLPVGATVVLKAGAQVMLVKNLDREEGGRMVNGCVGRVLGFWKIGEVMGDEVPDKGSPAVRNVRMQENGETPVLRTSDDDEGENKENKLEGKPASSAGPRPRLKPQNKEKDPEHYPLVFFSTPQGSETVLLVREEFRVEDSEGTVLARRMQIPLALAWAMSIHKSQGQTIQRVKIDLRKVFERGQSYVALSRAASLDGLQVIGFDPKKVMAHPKVIEWSKTLEEHGATA